MCVNQAHSILHEYNKEKHKIVKHSPSSLKWPESVHRDNLFYFFKRTY